MHPGAAHEASSVTLGACLCPLPAATEGSAIVTAVMTTTAILDACLELMTASFAVVCKVPAGESTLSNAPSRVNAAGQKTYVTRATG